MKGIILAGGSGTSRFFPFAPFRVRMTSEGLKMILLSIVGVVLNNNEISKRKI